MNVTLTIWIVTLIGIIALIALDFVVAARSPHHVGMREAALWSVFYIVVACAFGISLFFWASSTAGTEFFAAYLVEKSLSVDNLFVFAIILTKFAVPDILQQRVLLFGIVLALVFRAIFIAVGAAALSYFAFTFVIFGALLIWTGVQLARHRNEDPDPGDNFAMKLVRKRLPITEDFHGPAMFTRIDGKRWATPMLLVIIAIGSTDLLFALDSIPATFGVTQEPYLVFAANAFALLGLRALYFLLKGLLDKLVYLSLGLAVILVFIGVKLILTWAHETWSGVPKIPTVASLIVIALILIVTTVASLIKTRNDPTAIAHAGTVTAPKSDPKDKPTT